MTMRRGMTPKMLTVLTQIEKAQRLTGDGAASCMFDGRILVGLVRRGLVLRGDVCCVEGCSEMKLTPKGMEMLKEKLPQTFRDFVIAFVIMASLVSFGVAKVDAAQRRRPVRIIVDPIKTIEPPNFGRQPSSASSALVFFKIVRMLTIMGR
jgi:hypothetical protein